MNIIGILSLILDLTIMNFSNYSFCSINAYFPYLTLVYVISIFYFEKKYNILLFILLFIYSVIINSNIALSLILFSFLWLSVTNVKKRLENSFLTFILCILICLLFYDILFYLFMVVFSGMTLNIEFILYKFVNSILLNAFWAIVIYYTKVVLKPLEN